MTLWDLLKKMNFLRILNLKTTKKNLFKLILATFIVCIIGLSVYYVVFNKVEIKECANKNLIKNILENLNEKDSNQNINILKVFYYNLPETKYFGLCGYVVEKTLDNNAKNQFVVFSDKNISLIFLGDFIDIKNKKIVGYDELIGVRQQHGTDRIK